jgi:hypothetical protein
MMSLRFRNHVAGSFLAVAAAAGWTACSSNPASPSDGAGATVAGTVSRSSDLQGLTVSVVGTGLSATVERSGYFQIGRVPSGNVQLNFKDPAIDATTQLSNVAQGELVEIQVQLTGGSATIVSETRSNSKVALCHRTDSGEYHQIEVSVNAEQAHRDHGDGKVGEPVPGTQRQVFDARCRPEGPAVQIKKSTNGEDADTAPGPTILVGGAVTWRYVVTNTGSTPLTGIIVDDDRGVSVGCGGQTSLEAGQTMTCTGTGVATLGQYRNVGRVRATAPGAVAVDDTDPSHYLGVTQIPSGEITICHIPPGNYAARHTIAIDSSAWPAHQRHCAEGTCDYLGACR